MGERALREPVLGARAGAVFGTPAADQRLHADVPNQTAVLAVVAQHHVRAAPGPAPFAPHRRHRFEQGDQLGDAVAVAASRGGRERDAGGVGDQVTLAQRPRRSA
ncbi:hypothetical protein ACFRQM_19475 [Streptomyces sp. NPDC056831]|uniref:hypothetical protein n=1 Tax=Streptomyces sp. NPDC056831 TaxID=3345954 RepID=UPI0036A9BBE4